MTPVESVLLILAAVCVGVGIVSFVAILFPEHTTRTVKPDERRDAFLEAFWPEEKE